MTHDQIIEIIDRNPFATFSAEAVLDLAIAQKVTEVKLLKLRRAVFDLLSYYESDSVSYARTCGSDAAVMRSWENVRSLLSEPLTDTEGESND